MVVSLVSGGINIGNGNALAENMDRAGGPGQIVALRLKIEIQRLGPLQRAVLQHAHFDLDGGRQRVAPHFEPDLAR